MVNMEECYWCKEVKVLYGRIELEDGQNVPHCYECACTEEVSKEYERIYANPAETVNPPEAYLP